MCYVFSLCNVEASSEQIGGPLKLVYLIVWHARWQHPQLDMQTSSYRCLHSVPRHLISVSWGQLGIDCFLDWDSSTHVGDRTYLYTWPKMNGYLNAKIISGYIWVLSHQKWMKHQPWSKTERNGLAEDHKLGGLQKWWNVILLEWQDAAWIMYCSTRMTHASQQ